MANKRKDGNDKAAEQDVATEVTGELMTPDVESTEPIEPDQEPTEDATEVEPVEPGVADGEYTEAARWLVAPFEVVQTGTEEAWTIPADSLVLLMDQQPPSGVAVEYQRKDGKTVALHLREDEVFYTSPAERAAHAAEMKDGEPAEPSETAEPTVSAEPTGPTGPTLFDQPDNYTLPELGETPVRLVLEQRARRRGQIPAGAVPTSGADESGDAFEVSDFPGDDDAIRLTVFWCPSARAVAQDVLNRAKGDYAEVVRKCRQLDAERGTFEDEITKVLGAAGFDEEERVKRVKEAKKVKPDDAKQQDAWRHRVKYCAEMAEKQAGLIAEQEARLEEIAKAVDLATLRLAEPAQSTFKVPDTWDMDQLLDEPVEEIKAKPVTDDE